MLSDLTRPQRNVLALLLENKSTAEIAVALGISTRTAKRHMLAVLDRLGLRFRRPHIRLDHARRGPVDITAAAREIDSHVQRAQSILDEYLNPDGRYKTAALALDALLSVLDNVDLVRAQQALGAGLGGSTEPRRTGASSRSSGP